ncbi:MAG: hypothetical protein HYV07_09955 [Deltaproteobacteria bacterium]|nr:hypothetical protein [Deltaproteobacteria bacterium]
MVASAEPTLRAAPVAAATPKPWFIHGPYFDAACFIGMPLLAFGLIATFALPRVEGQSFLGGLNTPAWLAVAAAVTTFTHINLTVARLYLNKAVFRRFALRAVLAPILAFAILATSSRLLAASVVIVFFWDEWHSLLQTFGLGRIYDSKLGNDRSLGRWLDMGMCFAFEWLPYLVAITIIPFDSDDLVRDDMDAALARRARFLPPEYFRYPLVILGAAFLAFYLFSYYRMSKRGYRVSPAKLALFACTALANLLTLSFYTLLEASLMANIYHALQFIALIWVSERASLAKTFRTVRWPAGVAIAFLLVLLPCIAAGATRLVQNASSGPWLALWLTASMLHFWSDGFIWSVRKDQAV